MAVHGERNDAYPACYRLCYACVCILTCHSTARACSQSCNPSLSFHQIRRAGQRAHQKRGHSGMTERRWDPLSIGETSPRCRPLDLAGSQLLATTSTRHYRACDPWCSSQGQKCRQRVAAIGKATHAEASKSESLARLWSRRGDTRNRNEVDTMAIFSYRCVSIDIP